jgi:hypothetical protein
MIDRFRAWLDLARALFAVPHLIEQNAALELRVDELEQRHDHLAKRHERLAVITEELYLGPRSDRSGASARRPTREEAPDA